MTKRRLQQFNARGYYDVDDEATPGATVGVDLVLPDGTVVTAAMIINPPVEESGERTRWSELVDIPPSLIALAALPGSGIVVQTGANTFENRSVTSSADFTVTNQDGVAGNIDLALSFTISAFAKTFLDDADAAAVRTTIGAEPTIAAGTAAQYWRGDKTWQTLDKGAVGLGNVDNTSDLGKPVSTAQAAINAALAALNATQSAVASGTVYTITTTVAAVDFGTTDPAIVIPAAGTWLVLGWLQVDSVAATVGTTQNLDLRVRRTNNTPADLAQAIIDLPAQTAVTHTVGAWELPATIYVTANNDDAITLFAGLSAALGAGSMNVVRARIAAIRMT